MKEYIVDDRLFIEHQTGVINGYSSDDLQVERDILQGMIDDIQEQITYYDNIIEAIKPVVKVSLRKRITNLFRKT